MSQPAKKDAAHIRHAAAVRLTFVCVSGFLISVVVATGWGMFPAMAVLFMTCLAVGMTASACSFYARNSRPIPSGSDQS